MNQFDVYGKTYGANKYETSIMRYALSLLAQLPAPSLDVLTAMAAVER